MVESRSRAEKGKCPTLADGDHKIDFCLAARVSGKGPTLRKCDGGARIVQGEVLTIRGADS